MKQTFSLPYPPSVNSYLAVFKGRKIKTTKAKEYCRLVSAALAAQSVRSFGESRIEISINAYPPDWRRRDIDNIVKALFDSMGKAGLYDDDCQIDFYSVRRMGKEKQGRISLTVETVDNHWIEKYIVNN